MANTDFSVLLKAELDRAGLNTDLKQVQEIVKKYHLELTPDLQTKSLRNQFRSVCQEMANDFNRAFNANVSANDVFKVYENKARQLQRTLEQVNKIQLSLDNGYGVSEYQNRIQSLINDFERYGVTTDKAEKETAQLSTILASMKTASGQDLINLADKLEAEFKNVKISVDSAKLSYDKFLQPVSNEKASALIVRINSFLTKNTAITAEAKTELQSFVAQINNGVNLGEWNKFNSRLKEIENEMRVAGKLGKSLKQTLKDGAKSFLEWTTASGAIMEVWTQVRNGVRFIGELDDALTDVTYTSNVSTKQLEELGNSAIDMAKNLNSSAENILDAVKIYSTANATAEDILRKAQPAIMLSNISGMNGSESSKTINTSLNQFEIEDTEENLLDITDTLQYVSSQLNYDFTEGIKEITEGIEASGSVAKNAGLNMQEYATMVGVAVEKTGQSGSTIGNAYKTVFSRITKASSTEGTLADDISAAEKSLRSIGVEVRDSENEFRDLTDILADLGEVWDSLSSVEKSNVGFQVAGTRQLNVLNSLFGSWDSYSAIMEDIDERTGETLKNQEVYAESLKGHLGDLSAVGQSVWNNVIESDTLKMGVDLLTGLLTIVDNLTKSFGLLGTIGVGGGIFAAFKSVDYLKMPVCPHHI